MLKIHSVAAHLVTLEALFHDGAKIIILPVYGAFLLFFLAFTFDYKRRYALNLSAFYLNALLDSICISNARDQKRIVYVIKAFKLVSIHA